MDASLAKGLRVGRTIIIGRCVGINPINSQHIVFSEDQIEVNVIILDKIKIFAPLRKIPSGTILPASIWGVPNISPMILGTLQQSKVKWHTSQPDVIEINSIFSEAGIEYDEQDLISVRLKALNPGTAKIQAEFISPSNILSCFFEITVFKILELELPKRITSDTIIVPPRSQINLKANLPDAQFNFAEKSVGGLKVTKDGILKTSEHIGRDMVIATSEDQTLSIPIETKNIHYVLATLHTPTFKLRQIESKIPSGMNLILKVSLHDNLGNEFSHDSQDTSMLIPKLAIHESVEVNLGNNFSIALSLLRETSNMLSVSLRNAVGIKYNEDFIKLSVSKSTGKFPTKKIFSVGDIICFESPLVSMGAWISSDDSVLRVDRETGISLATGSHSYSKYGEQITVTNGNEHFGYIKYDVEIREADTIEFFQINDVFNGKNYKAHLLIKNHLQIDKVSNVIAKNATTCLAGMDRFNEKFFNCNIKLLSDDSSNAAGGVLNLITIAPVFDRTIGAYACELKPKSSIADIIGLVKNDEIQLEVTAILMNGVPAKAHLKLVPAISVVPTEIQLEQIDQQIITITGLDKILQRIQVSTSDPKSFEAVSKSKTHGKYEYKIRLLKNLPDDETVFLIINSPLTMQTIQIPIQSVKLMQKCLSQPFQSFSTMALGLISNLGLIVSMLIVLSATIWGKCKQSTFEILIQH